MLLPGIPPYDQLRNILEQISYFIKPLFLLVALCHGCYGAHTMTNNFEKITIP